MIYVSITIGVLFIGLGLFLIFRAIKGAGDRERLLYAGFGAIAVGISNITLLLDDLVGFAALAIGIFLIFYSARSRRESSS